MNVPTPRHGEICVQISYLLRRFLEDHPLGRVVSNDSGVRTERDPDTMRRTAHNLKGSSSIVGAQRLAALCAEIEDGLTSAAHQLSANSQSCCGKVPSRRGPIDRSAWAG